MWFGKKNRFWKNGLPVCNMALIILISLLVCACRNGTEEQAQEKTVPEIEEQNEYEIPVPEEERIEAQRECETVMMSIKDIWQSAEKGKAINAELSDRSMNQMSETVAELGYPVRTSEAYSNMRNYKIFEGFLKNCQEGDSGTATIYQINSEGGIRREKYEYDGKDMYVFVMIAAWEEENPVITSISYSKIKTWKYLKRGWFCYEICVPEYPEVTEMVDGNFLIRVRPMGGKKKRYTKKFVMELGYQGNNLLCSNWDINHMQKLDYNGIYEYFYAMKYRKKFPAEKYPDGIPEETFEHLIKEYLPVDTGTIRRNAAYNPKNNTYEWMRLGCFNYSLSFFGTSVPEVTHIRKNPDGTITLTVDAVCEMIRRDVAVITHELTVKVAEDGSFQYIGNRIKGNGLKEIPKYEYRIPKSRGSLKQTS